MASKEASRYCLYCGRWVLARQEQPNHVLHALLTIFTCCLWAAVWLFILINAENNNPWLCPTCGGPTEEKAPA
jgi:hypothetical protein